MVSNFKMNILFFFGGGGGASECQTVWIRSGPTFGVGGRGVNGMEKEWGKEVNWMSEYYI